MKQVRFCDAGIGRAEYSLFITKLGDSKCDAVQESVDSPVMRGVFRRGILYGYVIKYWIGESYSDGYPQVKREEKPLYGLKLFRSATPNRSAP